MLKRNRRNPPPTLRGLVPPLGFGLVLGALFIGGCDSAGETTALGISAGEPSFAMSKVEVCHRNKDGSYVRISIADAAYDTHLAHGDLPAGTGGLDADCQPDPTCPCFSADDIDSGVVWGWVGWVNNFSGEWDLELWDPVVGPMGFTSTGSTTLGYTCGAPLQELQEGLTLAQGEDCKAIILELGPVVF
jgi:hypothetical protein